MEFLGVGPTEFLFIIVIALIVLGPKDLAKTGSTIGKWLNNLVQSDGWKAIRKTSDELRRLPTQLMREENLKNFPTPAELQQQAADRKRDTWMGQAGKPTTPPRADLAPVPADENTIRPPRAVAMPSAEKIEPAKKKSAATPRKKATPAKKKVTKPVTKPTPRKKPNA
jgi:sec-independent protein translocase protein TatB